MKPVVALVNVSTVLKDEAIASYLPVLQTQVTRDFAPVWGQDADLIFVEDKTLIPKPEWWQLLICDNSDVATALGYHDLTATARPIGKVFAGTDLEYGEDWRITLSHETLEMLADPFCHALASTVFEGRAVFTVKEACDAVEADACAYQIDGQPVSDFVTPAFFDTDTQHPEGTAFDFQRHLVAPMTITPGGYLSILDPRDGHGWRQVFGQHVPVHKRLPPNGSRRERFLLRENHRRPWQRSIR